MAVQKSKTLRPLGISFLNPFLNLIGVAVALSLEDIRTLIPTVLTANQKSSQSHHGASVAGTERAVEASNHM
jgi:hypothetical protein